MSLKNMRKFSITDKLVVASIFISVVTIIIVASFSFYRTKDAILERTFNQLTSVRVIKTNLIEKFFNTCIKEVKLAKSSSDIINLTQQINDTGNIFNYEKEYDLKPKNNLFLKEVSEDYYNRIFIISKSGNIFFIKNSEKECDNSISDFEDLINKTTEKSIFIKDYSKNDSCNYITLSSVILSKENEYEGIIVFEISSEPIDVVMLENNSSGGLGKSGESYLVGKDYLMRSSSRFQNESIMKTIVKNQAVEAALKNKTGTVIIEDYRGVKVLSSFGKLNLPFFDWVILAEIDYQEAVVPIYKIRSEIIFISIFIFIFILIAVIILSKMMTYPLRN